ncbi:MAG: membrane protein insertion efficiency factor YidD [Clostridia bacterium]|nr:membrane protein insertion efficiency factor YidD [Clostridia bacterium]MBR3593054.1 membrane protein insertion efficiency factor YidD [Clostridia bacterium]
MKRILIKLVRLYQKYISPQKGYSSCRFTPTCSAYAIEAIETHGALKGAALAIYRVIRCNPLCKGGYDPVPPRKSKGEN